MKTIILGVAAFLSGLAALSWEVVWQLRSSLALGVSSWGAALTLAALMGGLAVGALTSGRLLDGNAIQRQSRAYALLEAGIGVWGCLLPIFFGVASDIDTWVAQYSFAYAPLVYLLSQALIVGIPACFMGATIPLFGRLSQGVHAPLSALYGLNTLGGAVGSLAFAFFLIPHLGVQQGSYVAAGANFLAAALMLLFRDDKPVSSTERAHAIPHSAMLLSFVTGFVTLALEVAWFRAFRAAFRSTTEAFALMLAAALIALGLAARFAPDLRKRGFGLGSALFLAAMSVLLLTPAVERYDLVSHLALRPVQLTWFFLAFGAMAPVLIPLGLCLPSLLDAAETARGWGRLYAINSLGAVCGALVAAWGLLPMLGFGGASLCLGLLLALVALTLEQDGRLRRVVLLGLGVLAALYFDSGVGSRRVIGRLAAGPYSVVAHREAPDSAISVVQFEGAERALVIDGFHAATELDLGHYMKWMGHLPMMLHPNPQRALVICFGTGQTANAVRLEGPESLTIVDVNRPVFEFAHYFSKNQAVLEDSRVHQVVMDGRAFLRRSKEIFDVITLEPMPPNYAGVNALYSKEFYSLARQRLSERGTIAQWVTFRLVAAELNAAVVKTFTEVFPNSLLWIDPKSQTGIIVGSKSAAPLAWSGFQKVGIGRDLTAAEVEQAVALREEGIKNYTARARTISDDNQLLSYGQHIHDALLNERLLEENLDLVRAAQPRQVNAPQQASELNEMQGLIKQAAQQAADAAKRDVQTIMGLAADRLVSAAFAGDTAQIEILVQQGADVNLLDPKYNITPLSAAASRGQLAAIESLLKLGANIEGADKVGFTALMNAAMNKQLPAVKLLLQRGAKLSTVNIGRQNAADLAKMMGALEVAQYLQSAGVR